MVIGDSSRLYFQPVEYAVGVIAKRDRRPLRKGMPPQDQEDEKE